MNLARQKLLETYSAGDYSHLMDPEFEKSISFAHCPPEFDLIGHWIGAKGGDTLLLFLWRELGDDVDGDIEEAVRRIEIARHDLTNLLGEIEALLP